MLISIREVKEATNLSISTLKRLTKDGRIGGYKVGRRVLYKMEDVMQYIESCKIQPIIRKEKYTYEKTLQKPHFA